MSQQVYMPAKTDDKEEYVERGVEFKQNKDDHENATFLVKLKNNKRIIGVVCGILLLTIILFIAFMVYNNSSGSDSSAQKSLTSFESNNIQSVKKDTNDARMVFIDKMNLKHEKILYFFNN